MSRNDSAKRLRSPVKTDPARVANAMRSLPALHAANASQEVELSEVNERVDAIKASIVASCGGEAALTPRQRVLLEHQEALLLAVVSATFYLRRAGAIGGRGKTRPVLAVLTAFTNASRHNLAAMGLSGTLDASGPDADIDAVIAEIKAARIGKSDDAS